MKERESNIELLRIILMFFVVAHHVVTLSGVESRFEYLSPSVRMYLLQAWGAWGASAINAFVLISGYFLCTSYLRMKRVMHVWWTAQFWILISYIVFVCVGKDAVTVRRLIQLFTWPFKWAGTDFVASFLCFYVLVPFYNLIVRSASARMLWTGTLWLLAVFLLPRTLFNNGATQSYVFWLTAMYFLGACFRLYPARWMCNNRVCIPLLVCILIICFGTVVYSDALAKRLTQPVWYYQFVCGCSSVGALLTGSAVFLVFKNLKVGSSRIINWLAATTFGILCVHNGNPAIRHWLWNTAFPIADWYSKMSASVFFATIVGVTIVVFIISSFLEGGRVWTERVISSTLRSEK